MAEYKFDAVCERDMDTLFAEALGTDEGFLSLFTDRILAIAQETRFLSVELSHTELSLGESDITMVVENKGHRFGILIEDKIDAIDMEDQHARYIKRAEVAKKRGDYEDYAVFIVCPHKYYEINDEAKLYENHVFYEECLEYFSKKDDPVSEFRCQQISQAIEKAKRPPKVTLNEQANQFYRYYKEYQEKNYPMLDLTTKENANGYWAHYRTLYGEAYMFHKIEQGVIDLTFNGTADMLDRVISIGEWLKNHNMHVTALKTGKSASIRMIVPKMEMNLDKLDAKKMNECFEAISELDGFMRMLRDMREVYDAMS